MHKDILERMISYSHANYPQNICIEGFGKFQFLNLCTVSPARQKFDFKSSRRNILIRKICNVVRKITQIINNINF